MEDTYELLREDMAGLGEAIVGYQSAVTSHLLEQSRQIDKLWKDNAALRDELHALANRVETLTRARLTEPAEVAERMTPQQAFEDAAHVRRMAREYE